MNGAATLHFNTYFQNSPSDILDPQKRVCFVSTSATKVNNAQQHI